MIDFTGATPGSDAGGSAAQEGVKQQRSAVHRAAAVETFIKGVLADGAVAVADLEVRARTAGLLGERQRITDAKVFKRAKKKLGVQSIRDGFGSDGEWFWALPSNSGLAEADLAPKAPEAVVYADDHSRPEQPRPADRRTHTKRDGAPIQTAPSRRVPADWVRGVARLHHRRHPAGVPQHRWHLFLDDCARFLDPRDGWAERAAELGWDAEALFGCDPKRPLDHIGSAGLVWRVLGGRLTALHKDWAMITTADDAQRVFHRRPAAANITLPWRLR